MSTVIPQSGPKTSHLGPNNFTIGHDNRMTQSSLLSVFKNDYPVHNAYGRAEIAKPPRLGDVMHKDDRYICDRASETVTSFQYTPMAKPVLMDVQNTLRVTNFKMDSDVSKVNSFATTHDHYYQPKYLPLAKRSGDDIGIYTSHIPQGDPEKADAPLTNYRDKFPGHDPRQNPTIKAPTMHHGGPRTIKGDGDSVDYGTSNNDQFQGRWAPAPSAFPAGESVGHDKSV
nr:hypothetical protein BaRGS_022983 [Batillaria attramentaria]